MTNTIERPLGIERQQITIGELEDRAYELKEKLLRLCGSYEGAVHIGGDLSVASLPGQGATFTFTLTLDLSPSGDPA